MVVNTIFRLTARNFLWKKLLIRAAIFFHLCPCCITLSEVISIPVWLTMELWTELISLSLFLYHPTDPSPVLTIDVYPWTYEALKMEQGVNTSHSQHSSGTTHTHMTIFPPYYESRVFLVPPINPAAFRLQPARKCYWIIRKRSIVTCTTRTLTPWIMGATIPSLDAPS